jgi:hypothetical protein
MIVATAQAEEEARLTLMQAEEAAKAAALARKPKMKKTAKA